MFYDTFEAELIVGNLVLFFFKKKLNVSNLQNSKFYSRGNHGNED